MSGSLGRGEINGEMEGAAPGCMLVSFARSWLRNGRVGRMVDEPVQ